MATFRLLAPFLAIFCIVSLTRPVHAQDHASAVEDFLTPLIKGKSDLAFDKLVKSSATLRDDKTLLGSVKRDYTALAARAGRIVGFEKIREEPTGSSLKKVSYLLRGDKLPIIWDFVLYDGNADGAWEIIEMKCGTQVLAASGSLDKSGL